MDSDKQPTAAAVRASLRDDWTTDDDDVDVDGNPVPGTPGYRAYRAKLDASPVFADFSPQAREAIAARRAIVDSLPTSATASRPNRPAAAAVRASLRDDWTQGDRTWTV
jgi:hypothetical protein